MFSLGRYAQISAPSGYFFIWNGNGANFGTILGSPIDDTPGDPNDSKGVNLAAANCQPSDHTPATGDKVLLGTIQILNFGAGQPCEFLVKRKSPPSNPVQADCPLVAACDVPIFTKIRLTPQTSELGREAILSRAFLNKTCTAPCSVPTAPLGIYADAAGTQARLCVEQGTLNTFHLVGKVPDALPAGVTGAEFRIAVSNPTGYVFQYSPPSGASVFGSPFDLTPGDPTDATGATVVFTGCQPSPTPQAGDLIGLGTVSVFNLSGGTTSLEIRSKNPPGPPGTQCPRFFLCDSPFFSPQCMSPSIGGTDLVYQTELNAAACLPQPFATETLQLDTYEAFNDGFAGPISTLQTLDHRQTVLITVQGTASRTSSTSWLSPPGVICGFPERTPQTPSPGTNNFYVGSDAEFDFAAALAGGADCQNPSPLGHSGRLEVNLGTGFQHIEPLGGAPTQSGPGHLYRYFVTGQDQPLQFRWADGTTNDDYGILSIHIQEANATDTADPIAEHPPGRPTIAVSNIPDPFNPSTVVEYALPAASAVTVRLFDIRGRLVRELEAGPRAEGMHRISWDGRDTSGRALPSGVYWVRVESALGVGTERMTLVR